MHPLPERQAILVTAEDDLIRLAEIGNLLLIRSSHLCDRRKAARRVRGRKQRAAPTPRNPKNYQGAQRGTQENFAMFSDHLHGVEHLSKRSESGQPYLHDPDAGDRQSEQEDRVHQISECVMDNGARRRVR